MNNTPKNIKHPLEELYNAKIPKYEDKLKYDIERYTIKLFENYNHYENMVQPILFFFDNDFYAFSGCDV